MTSAVPLHGTSWWTCEGIEKCTLGVMDIETYPVSILTVTPRKGSGIILGIDDQVSRARIEELLRGKGVKLEIDS
jgi:hypothetical protein